MHSPVLFQSVDGAVESSPGDTSKYNQSELKMVFRFIDELLKTGNVFGKTVRASDIGVVTPYTAQALKVSEICAQTTSYNGVMVGTGPIFQGKEKTCIIISMVVNGKCSKFVSEPRVSFFDF